MSVPWVIATPATSGSASSSFDALGELEPDLVVHVLAADAGDLLAGDLGDVLELRNRLRSGCPRPRRPTGSPASVCDSAAPAMVPPVARITILGFFCGHRARMRAAATLPSRATIRRVFMTLIRLNFLPGRSIVRYLFLYCVGSRLVSLIGSSSSLICASVRTFFSRMTSRMPLPLLLAPLSRARSPCRSRAPG